MIEGYLNQRAVWKRKTGSNEYGEPVTKQKTIKVRWEGKRRLVRDKQGQEVVSEALFFCMEDVQPGDIISFGGKEWTVITVSEIPDLDGQVIYREAAC